MGAMAEDECAESTRNMLGAVRANGDREHAGQVVAALSLGWPQHLKGAQSALCRGLLVFGQTSVISKGSRTTSVSIARPSCMSSL